MGRLQKDPSDLPASIAGFVDAVAPGAVFTASDVATSIYPGIEDEARNSVACRIGRHLRALRLTQARSKTGGTAWRKPPSWVNQRALVTSVESKEQAVQTAQEIVSSRAVLRNGADIQRLAASALPPILAAALEIALDRSRKDSDRLKAAEMLLDRLVGKTTQTVEMRVTDARSLSTAELERILAEDSIDAEFSDPTLPQLTQEAL